MFIFILLTILRITPILSYWNRTKETIPNTKLQSHTLYYMGMKRFPLGIVTWTSESKWGNYYIQVDNDPTHKQHYVFDQAWYTDTLWEFIPSMNCGSGWYLLSNRGRSGRYATFAPDDFRLKSQKVFHMILAQFLTSKHKPLDYCLKPVEVEVEGVTYYQLIVESKMTAFVSRSTRPYQNMGSYYLQLDDRNSSKYSKNGEFFLDSLFTIKSVNNRLKPPGKYECCEDFEEYCCL